MPLFQGGLVRSHIDEALASQHAAEAQEKQVKLELTRDLADANDRYANARKQLDLLAQSQSTADDSFALDWTRFLGGGSVTILEVIDAYQQASSSASSALRPGIHRPSSRGAGSAGSGDRTMTSTRAGMAIALMITLAFAVGGCHLGNRAAITC